MKEKISLGIFIASIAAIVVLLISSQSSITGKSVSETDSEQEIKSLSEETSARKSCSDSDNGKDYFTAGNVEFCDENEFCQNEKDKCEGKKLAEVHCVNNQKTVDYYECEFGCDAGVCLTRSSSYSYRSRGGGGGGNAGGSSTAATAAVETGQTYDLGTLDSETELEIMESDVIQFSYNTPQKFDVMQANEMSLLLEINDDSEISFLIGEGKGVDLSDDGISDIRVKPLSINLQTRKMNIRLTPL